MAPLSWFIPTILIWLQTAEIACALPRPCDAIGRVPSKPEPKTVSFTTQYPPFTSGERVEAPETKGVYITKLERGGRPYLQPFPTFVASDPTETCACNSQSLITTTNSVVSTFTSTPSSTNFVTSTFTTFTATPSSTNSIVSTFTTFTATSSSTNSVTSTFTTFTATPSSTNSIVWTFKATHSSTNSIVWNFTNFTATPPSINSIVSTFKATHSSTNSVASTWMTTPLSTNSVIPSLTPTPSSTNLGSPSPAKLAAAMTSQNVFQPVSMDGIPSSVQIRNDHPVSRLCINDNGPVSTNKFFANFLLGSQNTPAFTHPYSLWWPKGSGNAESWGMAISHIESSMLAYGPVDDDLPGDPVSYYINPVGIQSMILSAAELGNSTVLSTDCSQPMSAQVILQPQNGTSSNITFPIFQGMGYVTGVYTNLQPLIQSSVFFRDVVTEGSPRAGIFKYRATLEDSTTWLIYVTPSNGTDPNLHLDSNTNLSGPVGFSGIIQIAKNPSGDAGEKFYDNSSGVYPISVNVTGSVTSSTGTYSLSWQKGGMDVESTPLLMFALPHHVESFDNSTQNRKISLQLRTTTKGNATAVIGESWTMVEPDLPTDMGFAPWSPSKENVTTLSAAAQQVLLNVAPTELEQNMTEQTDLDSMYYSGKALSKFAALIYTVNTLANDSDLAAPALANLKDCFARFANNQQQYPLVYDNVWKGVVSSASYVTGDSGVDFGNTYYNDHHFHYGYFIYAAAVIGSLDPSWVAENKDYVNMLVRDAGNSVSNDPYFPFSRMFDWFHGHSWAKGLFESYDGKDEESTSEDAMFAYAVKVWGKTIGDPSMEARGNLMLGILKRSFHNYFHMESDNTNQPSNFIANKVTGILFENKADHTTYFGTNLEYIQGIHMLPLMPNSAYTRSQKFVTEEWNAMFASNASDPAQNVTGGWKGILYANLALIDPDASWDFFSQSDFDYSWIDGGSSRTWYLAYAAGLGGGPA